ncbi:MAG: Fic family protein [Myxococcales bacterium]|jgi:Fic family protein|nr:Fic family protein [Myxococcales bacterium]
MREVEFIHPFADGNGRMGGLWQTLILRQWRQTFSYLPIEEIIRSKQSDYYASLSESDRCTESTLFIEFMLIVILEALKKYYLTEKGRR